MRFLLLALLLASSLSARVTAAADPPASPDPAPPAAEAPAPTATEPPVLDRPADRAYRLVIRGEPERAALVCRAYLKPDSSDAELRNILGQALVVRDQICLPLPPNVPAFQKMAEAGRWCDMPLVPPATRDTVLAELRAQAKLAPKDVESNLLVADFETRYGTREAVKRELDGLARFTDAPAREDIQTRLIGKVTTIKRQSTVAVIAEYLAGTDPATLDCTETETIVNALIRVAKFEPGLELVKRVASKGRCANDLLPVETTALILDGRYRELWELTRSLPPTLDTINYYRYSVTAVLAAAHFDKADARTRLAHERVNEEAYPPDAIRVLTGIDSLLSDPAPSAERWAALTQLDLLQQERFRDVRHLLMTLALRVDPELESANQALADDMVKRQMPLLAARHFESLAGGRNPSLDRRWDPRRPRFLRQAAENYFAGEDDASCLAMLALIPERMAEDELMAGVLALRNGDRVTARDALARAQQQARAAAMVDAVGQLAEWAGSTSP